MLTLTVEVPHRRLRLGDFSGRCAPRSRVVGETNLTSVRGDCLPVGKASVEDLAVLVNHSGAQKGFIWQGLREF